MKKTKLLSVLVGIISLCCTILGLYACNEGDLMDWPNNSTKYNNITDKDLLKTKFGYALAKVLAEDKDVRKIIRNEALKKINYDYDVLYAMIKNKKNHGGETVEELLLKYISKDSLSIITNQLPTLTIFVPELPENAFSAEKWDILNTIPKVAIRLSSPINTPILDNLGNKRILLANEIPLFPVVVIKENERITASKAALTRAVTNNELERNGFTFLDTSFNNLSTKLQTKNSATRLTVNNNFDKLKEAYNKYPNGTGWQRDYIYYNISSETPNGPFNYSYKEYIWGFEMVGDVQGAINKISDQSGDPQFKGNIISESGGKIRVSGSGWTDGEFEFQVKAYVASKTAVGNELTTFFRIKGTDLFDVKGYRNGDVIKVRSGENKKVLFQEPIPFFSWNLEDYSSTIKISIEEVDANETIKNTISSTNDFATNFSFDKTIGKTLKLGAQFGGSTKDSRTVTFERTTTLGNDELGEIVVNFGDIVLVDATNVIRSWTPPRHRPTSSISYPNFSPQYYTGWYRLYIAPGPIN